MAKSMVEKAYVVPPRKLERARVQATSRPRTANPDAHAAA
jgi:hypothetical protein